MSRTRRPPGHFTTGLSNGSTGPAKKSIPPNTVLKKGRVATLRANFGEEGNFKKPKRGLKPKPRKPVQDLFKQNETAPNKQNPGEQAANSTPSAPIAGKEGAPVKHVAASVATTLAATSATRKQANHVEALPKNPAAVAAAVASAKVASATAAKTVDSPSAGLLHKHTNENAKRLANSLGLDTSIKNPVSDVSASKKSREEGNSPSSSKIDFAAEVAAAKAKKAQGETASENIKLGKGKPKDATILNNITAVRASAGLSPAGKLVLGEGNLLKQSSPTNTKRSKAGNKLVLAEGNLLKQSSPTNNAPVAPKAVNAPVVKATNNAPVVKATNNASAAPKAATNNAPVVKAATNAETAANPIKNANSILIAAQKQGFSLPLANKLSSPAIAGEQHTRGVGKKTSKTIRKNIEKQQKLARKIKKAKEEAAKGPGFLGKVLSGFGFNTFGKTPEELQRYVDGMEERIQKLDQKIAQNQEKLTVKRATAQAKNKKATKKMVTTADARNTYFNRVASSKVAANPPKVVSSEAPANVVSPKAPANVVSPKAPANVVSPKASPNASNAPKVKPETAPAPKETSVKAVSQEASLNAPKVKPENAPI